jgi:hypothetical protein
MALRMAALPMLLAALAQAPLQCTGEPEPASALEETPGEALYRLAERFRERGDREAWRATLRYLVERYPSSRFAAAARRDLEEDAAGPPAQATRASAGDAESKPR